MSKMLKAGLVAFLIMAVASAVFYGVLMIDRFAVWEAEVARAEPNILLGFVAMLLFSMAMAAMYPKGYQGGDPVKEGARFGSMVALVLVSIILLNYTIYELQFAGSLVDMVFNGILVTGMGAAIGTVYGSGAD